MEDQIISVNPETGEVTKDGILMDVICKAACVIGAAGSAVLAFFAGRKIRRLHDKNKIVKAVALLENNGFDVTQREDSPEEDFEENEI